MTPHSRLTLSVFLLAGCRSHPRQDASTNAQAEVVAAYRCDDGSIVAATFHNDSSPRLDLVIGDTRVTLSRQVSADGGRYADSTTQFWDKGREARLTRSGTSTTCRRTP